MGALDSVRPDRPRNNSCEGVNTPVGNCASPLRAGYLEDSWPYLHRTSRGSPGTNCRHLPSSAQSSKTQGGSACAKRECRSGSSHHASFVISHPLIRGLKWGKMHKGHIFAQRDILPRCANMAASLTRRSHRRRSIWGCQHGAGEWFQVDTPDTSTKVHKEQQWTPCWVAHHLVHREPKTVASLSRSPHWWCTKKSTPYENNSATLTCQPQPTAWGIWQHLQQMCKGSGLLNILGSGKPSFCRGRPVPKTGTRYGCG